MSKIELDKYYTPNEIAKYCISIVNDLNLQPSEIIEPSAGSGSFSLQIPNCVAYDIKPEHPSIIQKDFFDLILEYKKGRLFIGNPPFGKGTVLSNKFTRRCFEFGDYVAFILPICQFNNQEELYEFDLIHSEDLGVLLYSGVEVHCCFNVYRRPLNGLNKKQKQYPLNDIVMKEVRKERNQYLPLDFKYDIGICIWGSIGVECLIEGQYSKELYIFCKKRELVDKVIKVIRQTKWNDKVINSNKTPSLTQRLIRKVLSEEIPELN